MNDFPYTDLILLGAIALFIALRLRSTLGKKIGFDGTPAAQNAPSDQRQQRQRSPEDEEREKKKREEAESALLDKLQTGDAKTGLENLKQRFADFSAVEFLDGAKIAFDMVFESFRKSDKTTLAMLLADDIEQRFLDEIDARAASDEKVENTLVSIESAEVTRALLKGDAVAEITVKFLSDQIHVVRDKEGKIIEGNPSEVVQVEDEWTFRRDMRSRDPNWQIIAL